MSAADCMKPDIHSKHIRQ